MVMAALGNALAHDSLRRDFVAGPVAATIPVLIGMEEFNAHG